jgi:methionyl-tRNA formyltransferase
VEALRATGADFLLVASYGQILSQAVLDTAPRGGINLHGSILPKYRGAAPIQRCIMDGQQQTGVTLMQMDKGMDTGDMIDVSRIPIGPDDTYGELQDRLGLVARELAERWAPRIALGDYPRTEQDDAEATLAPKLQKAEGELNIMGDAKIEYDRFRAFTPSPGSFLRTDLGQLRISSARLRSESGEPGKVISAKPGLVLAFGAGSLELLEVQPEGKKRMTGKDFANGARLIPGARLA